jgi:hypothetical protein
MEGHHGVIGMFFGGIERMVNDFECTDSADRNGFSVALFSKSFRQDFARGFTAT